MKDSHSSQKLYPHDELMTVIEILKQIPDLSTEELHEKIELAIQKQLLIKNEICKLHLEIKELNHSVDKYNNLFNYAPIGYFLLSKESVILDLNFSAADIIIQKKEEILGRTFVDFLSKKSLVIYQEFVTKVFQTNQSQTCELNIISSQNIPQFVLLEGVIAKNKRNFFLTVTNIPEIKNTVEERDYLLATVENTDDFIVVKDLNLRVVAANKAWLKIAGFNSLQEAIGKTDSEVWKIPEDSEPVATYMKDELRAQSLKPGEFVSREESIFTSDGKEVIVLTKKYPIFDSEGNLFCTGVVATDITERKMVEKIHKESELFLKQTQQIAMLGTYKLDITTGVWRSSTILDTIFGINDQYTKTITSWSLIIHPEWRDRMLKYFYEEVLGKRKRFNKEYKIIRQNDNSVRWVHGIGELQYDAECNVIGMIGTIRDITQRKQIDEQNRFLIASVENIDDRIVVKDLDLKIVAANKSWLAARGHTSIDALKGKTDADAFGVPANVEPIRTYMEDERKVQKYKAGEFLIRELPVKRANGEDGFALVKRFPIFDENGSLFCTGTVATDITQRKLMEEKLIRSEEKYRTVADYTYDWEYWIDPSGILVYCSPSCQKITGYRVCDFAENPQLLYNIVHPDDVAECAIHQNIKDLHKDHIHETQFRIIKADGTTRWLDHICQQIYNQSGKFIGVRGSNRDVTERKIAEEQLVISEQKYKLLSENISDGVFICRDGIFEYVNHAMNQIFGYENEELIGKKLFDLVIHDYSGELHEFIQSQLDTRQSKNFEIKCLKKNTEIVYIEALLNYVKDEDIIYGVAHNITERRQIQKRNILKTIIQTEEKEKAYFSKELHDGIGPLLSTIKLYLQWSERKKDENEREEIIVKAKEVLEEALTAVKEISFKLSPHILANHGLTSAILSFTNKIQITSAIDILVKSNMTRRIDIEVEIALYRAVIECINNTLKHAKAKRINIKLIDTGNQLHLYYIDDGIGFNMDEILIAQRGIGLLNLQSRIQTIGGVMNVFSEVGKGVEYQFIVSLSD